MEISRTAVQKIERSSTSRPSDLDALASVLNVRPELLVSGDGNIRHNDSRPHAQKSTMHPKCERRKIKARDKNTPLDNDEAEVPFSWDIEFACCNRSISKEECNRFMLGFLKVILRGIGMNSDESAVLCFLAREDSPEPKISDGDRVTVNTDDKRIIDGKIYAINKSSWKRIKVPYRIGPNRVSVRSYNKTEHPDKDKLLI